MYSSYKGRATDCWLQRAFSNVQYLVLLDFTFTVKAATLIFISGRGSAISAAKEGKSGCIYNLVNTPFGPRKRVCIS